MSSRNYPSASAENWDDDFEFSQTSRRQATQIARALSEPRLSVTSSHFSEDWDVECPSVAKPSVMTLLGDGKHPPEAGLHNQLQNWAETGPSTPTKRFVTRAENWDDDFEDKMDSPAQRQSTSQKTRHSYHTPSRPKAPADHENWDEEFEYAEKNNTPISKRSRQDAYVDSSDDEGEFGFGDKEEDRTVTTRSRSFVRRQSPPPPPVPALPQGLHNTVEPFPRSPSISVFSIPTTSGRNSVGYMSTSHLALKPTVSGPSLAMLPPSPPIHRERRRLRKKSRPPNLDNNVFELMEEQRDSTPPLPPSTPERSSPPPPPAAEATPSSNKTPLLSRIGSVKKWGVRRKRASTGPAEVMVHDLGGNYEQEGTPRPPSTSIPPAAVASTSSSTNARSGWFFRPGGALGSGSPPSPAPAALKYEKSSENLLTVSSSGSGMDTSVPSTPSSKLSRKKLGRTFDPNSSSEMAESSSAKPSLSVNARRPTSMQVPNGKFPASSGTGTRHASYGSSTGRASARVFSTPTPTESSEELNVQPQEGSRNFMGNVRKISLVGPRKHKKKKSTADIIPLPPLPTSSHPQNERTQSQQGDTRIPGLLPPIELQPPSPPQTINGKAGSQLQPQSISDGLESFIIPSSSLPTSFTPRSSPMTTSRTSPKSPSSPPQSASLGRTSQAPTPNASVPRRNSLGDLKIPARISQAQIGLKRDLGMVREFAASVDKLRELRLTYEQLLSEANSMAENPPPSRATSPTILSLARTRSRLRSNTNPDSAVSEHKQFVTSLQVLNDKYKIPWECAELLIELGNGSRSVANPPSSNLSSPPLQGDGDIRKGRERAITLSGEESKPPSTLVGGSSSRPPNPSWRASTGRHDLSQRQLVLLRDMLNNADSTPDYILPEDTGVNRQWRWGDAMSSTVTLPSEDSAAGSTEGKKRRMSRLRDMLRMLKRSHSERPPPPPPPPLLPPVPPSTTSLSTESSLGNYSQHHYPHGQVPRRGSKTSTGPDSIRSVRDQQNSPYGSPPLNHKPSPRRPSLASIFRIGQKNKSTSSTGESSQDGHSEARSVSRGSNMTGEDDWDRIDSAIDLDVAAHSLGIDGTATIKGKKMHVPYPLVQRASLRPVTPVRGPESSQLSLRVEASPRSIRPMRSIRLSNVEEAEDEQRQVRPRSKASNRSWLPKASQHRPPSRGQPVPVAATKSGSVRSAPPQPLDADGQASDFKLSMTPENIKPLLENAKEVHARLNDCIKEMQALLDTYAQIQS